MAKKQWKDDYYKWANAFVLNGNRVMTDEPFSVSIWKESRRQILEELLGKGIDNPILDKFIADKLDDLENE